MPLNAEINVVSLIDVMLLLMVIFMITAPMMQGGVEVRLPRADVRPLETKSGLVVTILRDGRLAIDQTRLSYDEFRVSFRSLAAGRTDRGVYLSADESVPHGLFVKVLGVIRAAGVSNVGIVAEPESVNR
jgi:biopolymer transport protein ExbD/biopolymer transport protein TolR